MRMNFLSYAIYIDNINSDQEAISLPLVQDSNIENKDCLHSEQVTVLSL